MGKGIQKSIQDYLSKIKKQSQTPSSPIGATSWLLSACKHPKTPSFAADRDRHDGRAATLSDVDRFLFENFNSLYVDDPQSLDYEEIAPEIKASNRFFISPGTSGSLMDEAWPSTASSSAGGSVSVPDESVAVTTFSKDPYDDFRRSMQEMTEARQASAGETWRPLDWEFMEDLLFCYLELNDRSVHKYVLAAFADMTVSLRRRYRKAADEKKGVMVT